VIGKRISIVLFTLGVLAGCQSTSSQNQKQGEVNNMEKVENYDGLISHYKSMLEQGSQDPKVKEELALAYFHKGDIESADFYVQHLQKEGVKTPSLYQLAGQVFDAKDNTSDAISAYLASIESGNASGQVHVLLAVSYTKLGQYDDAYQELNEARLKGYDDLVIKNNIAMIQMANGEFEQAIVTLTPILKDHPSNKVVKANLAIALIKAQKVDAARKLLKGDFSDQEVVSIANELTQTGSY